MKYLTNSCYKFSFSRTPQDKQRKRLYLVKYWPMSLVVHVQLCLCNMCKARL